MATVIVRKNEPIEKAIKRLRKIVENERILSTYASKSYHMSKGEKRRKKRKRAELIRRKMERKRKK